MKNKICTSCNQEKEISNFSKHQTGKFGVRSSCKNCEKLYQTKNKDKIQKYHKNWYKENKEVQLDSCHKRYQEKREVILNQCKDYYQSHKENIKMYPSSNPKQKKDRYLQRVYGITLEQYTKILKSQNGVCSICSQKEISKSRQGKIKQLSVDQITKQEKFVAYFVTDVIEF